MNGTLFIDGVEICEVKDVDVQIEENQFPDNINVRQACQIMSEVTFDMEIDPLMDLSLLFGVKVTNNWLKMRGGIMKRQCGKHKRKKWRRN